MKLTVYAAFLKAEKVRGGINNFFKCSMQIIHDKIIP